MPQSFLQFSVISRATPDDEHAAVIPDPQATDEALVRAIAEGDTGALQQLYQRHGLLLLAYLTGQVSDPQLAEEVLQDVMLAVWRGAGRFRADSKVTTWLLAIARRRAITARQRRPPTADHLNEMVPADVPTPLDTLEQQATRETVRAALRRLPNDQRETLELVFYHGLSGPEAAEVLGIAPGTVKSRLHRAKALLSRLLGQDEDHV